MPSPPARVEIGDFGISQVSPQVTALADSVNGFQPTGAMSQTAHRMREDRRQFASADEPLAQLRTGGAPPRANLPQPTQPLRPEAPEWHPFRDSSAVSSQAEKVLSALRMVESRQVTAPGWHPFRHVVGALDSQGPLPRGGAACPERGILWSHDGRSSPSDVEERSGADRVGRPSSARLWIDQVWSPDDGSPSGLRRPALAVSAQARSSSGGS